MSTIAQTTTPSAGHSWRDTPIHPLAADLFPLDPADSKPATDLADSIKRQGVLESIKLWQGQIIDGRRRFRVCLEQDREPRFEPLDLADDEAALCAIVGLNHDRRKQLSRAQRDELIVKLRHKGMSTRAITKTTNTGDRRVNQVIAKANEVHAASGEGTSLFSDKVTGLDGKTYPTQQGQSWLAIYGLRAQGLSHAAISKALGVSTRTIVRALKAQKAAEAKAAVPVEVEQPAPSSQEQEPEQAEEPPTPSNPWAKPDPSVWPSRDDVEWMCDAIHEIPKDVRPMLIDWVFEALSHSLFETKTSTAQERAEGFASTFLKGAWKAIETLKLPTKAKPEKPTPIKPKPAKGKASDPKVLADLAAEFSYAMTHDPDDDNALSDQGAA
jgi:transposase